MVIGYQFADGEGAFYRQVRFWKFVNVRQPYIELDDLVITLAECLWLEARTEGGRRLFFWDGKRFTFTAPSATS